MAMFMTDYEIAQMYRHAADKSKQVGILAQLNLTTRPQIAAVLERQGLMVECRSRPVRRKKLDSTQALALYEQGLSDREISARMEVAYTTVYSWRERRGLAANQRKEQDKNDG